MENVAQMQAPPGAAPAFEEVLARLNAVVEKLESGDLALEDSLALFEEGVRLSRQASARLDEAERRVERLLGGESASTSANTSTAAARAPTDKETEST